MLNFHNPLFLILLFSGIFSLTISIPYYITRVRTRKLEKGFNDVLNELAVELREGESIESALKKIGNGRNDLMGRELRLLVERMQSLGFENAMSEFGERSKSRIIARTVGIINLASRTESSLADVLERISKELWSIHVLEMERLAKTGIYSVTILWGGAVFCPVIIAFILSFFNPSMLRISFDFLTSSLEIFVIFASLSASAMHGIINGELRQSLKISPFFMLLAYISFNITLSLSAEYKVI